MILVFLVSIISGFSGVHAAEYQPQPSAGIFQVTDPAKTPDVIARMLPKHSNEAFAIIVSSNLDKNGNLRPDTNIRVSFNDRGNNTHVFQVPAKELFRQKEKLVFSDLEVRSARGLASAVGGLTHVGGYGLRALFTDKNSDVVGVVRLGSGRADAFAEQLSTRGRVINWGLR
ncbi:MAG: hypothetical protein ABL958_06630 [Bdellovibrionia bacterium]